MKHRNKMSNNKSIKSKVTIKLPLVNTLKKHLFLKSPSYPQVITKHQRYRKRQTTYKITRKWSLTLHKFLHFKSELETCSRVRRKFHYIDVFPRLKRHLYNIFDVGNICRKIENWSATYIICLTLETFAARIWCLVVS